MSLSPITIIIVVVLGILLGWLSMRLGEPWRTALLAVLAIAILLVILRLLGIY